MNQRDLQEALTRKVVAELMNILCPPPKIKNLQVTSGEVSKRELNISFEVSGLYNRYYKDSGEDL